MSCSVSLTATYVHLLSRNQVFTTFETGGSPKRNTTCGLHAAAVSESRNKMSALLTTVAPQASPTSTRHPLRLSAKTGHCKRWASSNTICGLSMPLPATMTPFSPTHIADNLSRMSCEIVCGSSNAFLTCDAMTAGNASATPTSGSLKGKLRCTGPASVRIAALNTS